MSEPGRSVTRTDQMNTTDPPGRLPPPDHRGVTCPLPQTAPRPWRPHSARSTASSARARSCASATRAALPPKAEIEGGMGDSDVGRQARLMSQALRKIAGADQHVHDLQGLLAGIRLG